MSELLRCSQSHPYPHRHKEAFCYGSSAAWASVNQRAWDEVGHTTWMLPFKLCSIQTWFFVPLRDSVSCLGTRGDSCHKHLKNTKMREEGSDSQKRKKKRRKEKNCFYIYLTCTCTIWWVWSLWRCLLITPKELIERFPAWYSLRIYPGSPGG